MEGPARVPRQPGQDLRVLVGAVVVEDGVDQLAGRDRRLDRVQEAEELLVAVALHAAAQHRAVEHVERGEQRGRAVALVVVGHRSRGRPSFIGSPGWVRSRAWIWLFSSTDSTTACAGGCM